MSEYGEYWPAKKRGKNIFSLDTVCAAMESRGELFLIGEFGGFGGFLVECHRDLDKAREAAKSYNEKHPTFHLCVYRMSMELIDEMLTIPTPQNERRE